MNPTVHCHSTLQWVMDSEWECLITPSHRRRQWAGGFLQYTIMPGCRGQCVVQRLQFTASLHGAVGGGSGQWESLHTLPHCS